MKQKVYLCTRFERFWHWAQAALIILLLITGFEIHGSLELLGFKKAYVVHIYSGIGLIVLTAFAVFWHLTTGAWKQYKPAKEKLFEICRFYLIGIFRGEPHPFARGPERKLNPLQRMVYLSLKIILYPLQIVTGVFLFFYPLWPQLGIKASLSEMACYHTLGAFAFLIFLILHTYLSTTGKPWYNHLRAMITGWEEVEVQ